MQPRSPQRRHVVAVENCLVHRVRVQNNAGGSDPRVQVGGPPGTQVNIARARLAALLQHAFFRVEVVAFTTLGDTVGDQYEILPIMHHVVCRRMHGERLARCKRSLVRTVFHAVWSTFRAFGDQA